MVAYATSCLPKFTVVSCEHAYKGRRTLEKADDTPVRPCWAGVQRLNVCVVAGSTGVCGQEGE